MIEPCRPPNPWGCEMHSGEDRTRVGGWARRCVKTKPDETSRTKGAWVRAVVAPDGRTVAFTGHAPTGHSHPVSDLFVTPLAAAAAPTCGRSPATSTAIRSTFAGRRITPGC